MITRDELKEIITTVVEKLETESPAPACGLLWADESPTPTTRYAVGEEDATTLYAIGEED